MTDPTTKKGRDEIASLAYKVARSKTTLDDMGKALTEEWKKKSAAVDAERKRMRERMDKLKDEVRKPLTDFENAEKERVESLQKRLKEIEALVNGGETQEEIKSRISALEAIDLTGWQEFEDVAIRTKQNVSNLLTAELEKRIKYDNDQAELARLREEQVKREQQEHEARIAAEAAEKARKDAEEKAAAEHRRIVAEKEAAELAAAKADEERIAAEKRASEAAQHERDRQAELKRQEDAAIAAREADKAHRATINNQAMQALITRFDPPIEQERAKEIVKAIALGEIPNIKIIY